MRKLEHYIVMLSLLAILAPGCDRNVTYNDTAPEEVIDNASCVTCHGDENTAISLARTQWAQSEHAEGETVERNRLNEPDYLICEKCHTHEGFVAAVSGVPASGDHFSEIGCFTCHAPHLSGDLSVRISEPVALANGVSFGSGTTNVCVACHQGRRDVGTSVSGETELSEDFGPHHSNQADMLVGTNAYEFAGYEYESSYHATGLDNGCLDCHYASPEGSLDVGGHTFAMEDSEDEAENLAGCNSDWCHRGNIFTFDRRAYGDFDWDGRVEGVQTEIEGLLDSLGHLLETAGLLDDEHPPDDVVVGQDTAGAVFNWLYVHEEQSDGIHNTDYAVGLLRSSINYMVHGNANGAAANRNTNLVSAH